MNRACKIKCDMPIYTNINKSLFLESGDHMKKITRIIGKNSKLRYNLLNFSYQRISYA